MHIYNDLKPFHQNRLGLLPQQPVISGIFRFGNADGHLFYALVDLRCDGSKPGALDRDNTFVFDIPECLRTDAGQTSANRDGFQISAVIEGLASDC